MTREWNVTEVLPMQGERVRFAHVVRHLYKPRERWDQIVAGLGEAREEAWSSGCSPALLEDSHPDCYRVTPQCRAHVLRDHDERLAPAYRDALATAEASRRWGRDAGSPGGWMFVGDNGVMVIVREVGRPRRPEVKTAYRVVPRDGAGGVEDYRKAAVRKLRDKTSWTGGGE